VVGVVASFLMTGVALSMSTCPTFASLPVPPPASGPWPTAESDSSLFESFSQAETKRQPSAKSKTTCAIRD
jgi:hypothetical protein